MAIETRLPSLTSADVWQRRLLHQHGVPLLTLTISIAAILVGGLSLALNSLEPYTPPLLLVLAVSQLLLALYIHRLTGRWDWRPVLLALVAVAGAAVLDFLLPYYFYGLELDAMFHRSFVSAILLICVGLPSTCSSLYYALGATPSAQDWSRYPLVGLPVLMALAVFGILVVRMVAEGAPGLGWDMLSTPYQHIVWSDGEIMQEGLRNNILGTLLTIGLAGAVSLPVGVGVGVYLAEYAGRIQYTVVKLSADSLRAVSLFILGLAAMSIAVYAIDTPLQDIFTGFWVSMSGFKNRVANNDGSFITTAVVLSFIVIPVVARATEEGLRSLPMELREGSHALGASEGHTLLHMLLPWALPGIVTGLLLGCAEAAGCAAIPLFIQGTGDYGVDPFREVVTLPSLITEARYGLLGYREMQAYTMSAGFLLLMITVGMTIMGLVLKRRFAARYRGIW